MTMLSTFPPRRFRWLGLLILTLVALPTELAPTGRADVIYLKDGLVLEGRVFKERDTISDPLSGDVIPIARANGFYVLDEGARYFIFNPRMVQDVENKDRRSDDEILIRQARRIRTGRLPSAATIVEASDFDANWRRILKIDSPMGPYRIEQAVIVLTPRFCRVDALDYAWTTYFLTQEVGPKTARYLLSKHPELLEKPGEPIDYEKRMRIYRFMVQAKWYDAAEAELDLLAKDLPTEKAKIDKTRASLKSLRYEAIVEELERRLANGSLELVRRNLAVLPAQGLEDRLGARVTILKSKVESMTTQLAQAKRHLESLREQVQGPALAFYARQPTPSPANCTTRRSSGSMRSSPSASRPNATARPRRPLRKRPNNCWLWRFRAGCKARTPPPRRSSWPASCGGHANSFLTTPAPATRSLGPVPTSNTPRASPTRSASTS
jgi:hypothetical protein